MAAVVADTGRLNDAGDALAVQVDILLDRLANSNIYSPASGTTRWRTDWDARDSDNGQRLASRRLLARIAIAAHAGVGPSPDVQYARDMQVEWPVIAAAAGGERADGPLQMAAAERTRVGEIRRILLCTARNVARSNRKCRPLRLAPRGRSGLD